MHECFTLPITAKKDSKEEIKWMKIHLLANFMSTRPLGTSEWINMLIKTNNNKKKMNCNPTEVTRTPTPPLSRCSVDSEQQDERYTFYITSLGSTFTPPPPPPPLPSSLLPPLPFDPPFLPPSISALSFLYLCGFPFFSLIVCLSYGIPTPPSRD